MWNRRRIIWNSFVKKVFIYFIGVFSSNLINILLLPIYAYHVSTEDLGTYDYYITIANVVAPLGYLSIWEAILKFEKQEDRCEKNYFCRQAIRFFFIISFVLICIGAISFKLLNDYGFIWIILNSVIFAMVYIWQFSSRAIGDNRGYALSGVVASVSFIVGVLLFIVWKRINYISLTVAHCVSQLFIVAVLEYRNRFLKLKQSELRKDELFSMLRFSAPLAVNAMSLWLYSGLSKVLINKFIGVRENGLYSFANKFSLLISLVSSVISLALIEEAYSFKNFEEYRVKVRHLISVISKGYFAAVTVALPCIYLLYDIAFKKTEYYLSRMYVLPLLLSALFMALASNFGSSIQVTGETIYIFITSIIGAGGSLLISIILIQKWGMFGLLWGGVAGYLIMMILRATYAWVKTRMTINWSNNFILLLTCFIEYTVLNYCKVRTIDEILLIIGTTTLIVFIYRKELKIALCHHNKQSRS